MANTQDTIWKYSNAAFLFAQQPEAALSIYPENTQITGFTARYAGGDVYETPSSVSKYELRVTLPQDRLVEVEGMLARSKALSVIKIENSDGIMSVHG